MFQSRSSWTSDFDIMRDHTKSNGVVLFFDKEGNAFRCDVHMKEKQSGVSGYWDVKLDHPESKDLTGSAKTSPDEKVNKLDVTFHAALK